MTTMHISAKRRTVILVGSSLLALCATSAGAAITLDDQQRFSVYGDFRARVEADWESRTSAGSERDDRNRMRVRARLGFNYQNLEGISMGLRLRTGSDASHQSPHITVIDFDDNDTGDADVNFDKWFFQWKFEDHGQFWVGRNSNPMWKQNELLWDDDVTPAGLAYRYGASNFILNAGYFSLPAGMQEFSGNLALIQLVGKGKVGNVSLTGGIGYLAYGADQGDVDGALLLDGNGGRDYEIWNVSGQATLTVDDKPLKLGVDYYTNTEDYSAADPNPFTAFHNDETDGYVLSALYGGTGKRGDWLVGYYYAHIEKFAVNASYAQDDWWRLGSATETRSSNFSGHEFRGAYAISDRMNLVARLYFVEAIEPRNAAATTKEDGNRFRLDLNFKF